MKTMKTMQTIDRLRELKKKRKRGRSLSRISVLKRSKLNMAILCTDLLAAKRVRAAKVHKILMNHFPS